MALSVLPMLLALEKLSKIKWRVGVALTLWLSAQSGRTQALPPVNDQFDQRIFLNGSSLTVTAEVAGATRELLEPVGTPYGWSSASGTVWWTWTAPEASPVTFVVEAPPEAVAPQTSIGIWTNNYAGFPEDGQPTGLPYGGTPIDGMAPFNAFTFLADSGAVYHIQVAVSSGASLVFHLQATNAPVILEQPQPVTALPGESVLFKVAAMGLPVLSYQWYHDQTALPGANQPMLALHDLTPALAGELHVTVAGLTGFASSAPARLTIPESETLPILRTLSISASQFSFLLLAEPGRSYRIESSTNLAVWTAEEQFPLNPSRFTSVVPSQNGARRLDLPSHPGPATFVRATSYQPANAICINQLKQLRFAKELWALDFHPSSYQTPMPLELTSYLPNNQFPACPLFGFYAVGSVGVAPVCSLPGHVIEEPR